MAQNTAPRTLVFCTAYATTESQWERRTRVWLDAILKSSLAHDQILIVDDGSPVLPNWPDVAIAGENMTMRPDAKAVIFHFRDNLGRPRPTYFPGWLRSFFFAASYADLFGFDKVIHIESDAFLITPRVQEYFNSVTEGWVALWCPRYKMPETGLQIIAGSAINRCIEFGRRSFDTPDADVIEKVLPFTHIEKSFTGDRYGEYRDDVPADADYVMQIKSDGYANPSYLWWLADLRAALPPGAAPTPTLPSAAAVEPAADESVSLLYATPPVRRHPGPDYKRVLGALDRNAKPVSYFEIGTNEGHSVAEISCDAVCVDPHFMLTIDALRGRRRTMFYQCTSDDFFHETALRQIFPAGVDIAFLDGLHQFEVLLRDFINTERECHRRSLILMHDCLPLNARMAERVPRVDETEDAATRSFWTGDVWRLLPILKKYRPDLSVHYLDCSPTGLVACSALNPRSDVLVHNYNRIVDEFRDLDLDTYGFETLWGLYPTIDTARALREPERLVATLGLG